MRLAFAALALATGLTSCHSAFINATVSNRSGERISVLEVDYPSASFGTTTLAPGQDFHYRFKVIGSGPIKVLWTDTANRQQQSSGPTLREGDDGDLTITFPPHLAAPTWNLRLHNR
jgi:hypothetical protein